MQSKRKQGNKVHIFQPYIFAKQLGGLNFKPDVLSHAISGFTETDITHYLFFILSHSLLQEFDLNISPKMTPFALVYVPKFRHLDQILSTQGCLNFGSHNL